MLYGDYVGIIFPHSLTNTSMISKGIVYMGI